MYNDNDIYTDTIMYILMTSVRNIQKCYFCFCCLHQLVVEVNNTSRTDQRFYIYMAAACLVIFLHYLSKPLQ